MAYRVAAENGADEGADVHDPNEDVLTNRTVKNCQ